jgi:hypothetical protein
MAYQVSVFAENKPGKIERVTTILAAKAINILAITISDAGDYGIIKLLLNNPEEGADALKNAGLPASLKEVVAVKVPDKPGGLAGIAQMLHLKGINVEDAYGFITDKGHEAIFVFQVQNVSHVESIIRSEGITVVSDRELYMI